MVYKAAVHFCRFNLCLVLLTLDRADDLLKASLFSRIFFSLLLWLILHEIVQRFRYSHNGVNKHLRTNKSLLSAHKHHLEDNLLFPSAKFYVMRFSSNKIPEKNFKMKQHLEAPESNL